MKKIKYLILCLIGVFLVFSALVNAMTNGNINLSNSINASEKDIDLIETDYH